MIYFNQSLKLRGDCAFSYLMYHTYAKITLKELETFQPLFKDRLRLIQRIKENQPKNHANILWTQITEPKVKIKNFNILL